MALCDNPTSCAKMPRSSQGARNNATATIDAADSDLQRESNLALSSYLPLQEYQSQDARNHPARSLQFYAYLVQEGAARGCSILRATSHLLNPKRAETRFCPMRAHSDRARSESKNGTWSAAPLFQHPVRVFWPGRSIAGAAYILRKSFSRSPVLCQLPRLRDISL